MSEPIVWIVGLGSAFFALGTIWLSRREEKNLRQKIEFMIRSDENMAARLRLVPGEAAESQEERLIGMVLERRRGDRRRQFDDGNFTIQYQPRNSPGRRSRDMRTALEV